jgi:hypothetical protein
MTTPFLCADVNGADKKDNKYKKYLPDKREADKEYEKKKREDTKKFKAEEKKKKEPKKSGVTIPVGK